ncbi:MAG: DoxX family protein [Ktedonobacteraceae bacterium]|nr:DoxX family protein [Ktedonobacteraceae bacterium]
MQFISEIARGISIASFTWYGLSCFLSEKMVAEFQRYRIARFRSLTGILQVGASFGLVVGHFNRPILLLSAGGLATMMFFAVIVRLRIRDPLYAALPALTLFALNLFIVVAAL